MGVCVRDPDVGRIDVQHSGYVRADTVGVLDRDDHKVVVEDGEGVALAFDKQYGDPQIEMDALGAFVDLGSPSGVLYSHREG